ncbi:MAG: protein kinase domain-containing protein, partial [Nannocystaceae bacterium]
MSDVEIPGEEAQSPSHPQLSAPTELDLFAEAMLSRMRRQVFQVDCPVTKIGRFSVGAPIGQGGMGVVYSAVDEQLGRTIALKVVRVDDGAPSQRHQHRLLREAQAMARLSHPNVVQVYEAGTHEGLVFIAMELIRGETLAAWLRKSREWSAVVRVFCESGRGLAAAHALGIVHRDFKPENVLIGDDERVRVTDFGIARFLSESDDFNATGPNPDGASEQTLTATGALPGTPFYMSPEQFSRGTITSRSDQFSFCVALFAALFGARPFPGESWSELVSAVSSGTVQDVRRGRVPRRVYRAILRGLSTDPQQRFPTMEALLAALEPRSYLRVLAPVIFAIAGTFVMYPAIDHVANPPCNAEAQLAGVWDEPIQEELARVFERGEPVDGDALWNSTHSQLSLYTEQWQSAYSESCRAHNDDKISAKLYALRVRCLERRLEVFERLTTEFRGGRSSVLLQAPLAASKLEEVERCADHDTLLLGMDPPPAAFVDTVDELRTEISSARADEIVGLLERSETKARATLNRALAVGYRPTLAEAHLQLGRVATLARKYDIAAEALRRAGHLAVETGHDEVALESRIWLVLATVIAENTPTEAEIWLAEAEAWMTRYSASPHQRALLQVQRGLVYSAAGKFGEAEHELREAVKRYQASPRPSDLDLLTALEQLANTLVRTRESR